MRISIGTAVLAALLLATASMQVSAQALVLAAGSHCQPTEPGYVDSLSYEQGAVTNAGKREVRVTCPLPAVVPGYMMVGASVALLDFDQKWGRRCLFHNLWPGQSPQPAVLDGLPNTPWIATAEIAVDSSVFVPHSVICPLVPGQTLYGLTIQLEPL
jgi:hypothetical protein